MGEARRRRLVGNVAIWKTSVRALEEVDRMMALHRAANAASAIDTASVDVFWVRSRPFGTVVEWDMNSAIVIACQPGIYSVRRWG